MFNRFLVVRREWFYNIEGRLYKIVCLVFFKGYLKVLDV